MAKGCSGHVKAGPSPQTLEYDSVFWKKQCWTCSSDECFRIVQCFVRQVLGYEKGARVVLNAIKVDPTCVLANALAASYLLCGKSGNKKNFLHSRLNALNTYLENDEISRYERLVALSIISWGAGNMEKSIIYHLELAAEYPQDLLSVKRGQLLCFYLGKQDVMLRLAEKAMPFNLTQPYAHGLLAFALVENHRMAEAAQAARQGLAICPCDVWCQHALLHCRSYAGGVQLPLSQWSHHWNSCGSFLYSHMWWHVALWQVEESLPCAQALVSPLQLYDSHVWGGVNVNRSSALVHLNAISLLAKLLLCLRAQPQLQGASTLSLGELQEADKEMPRLQPAQDCSALCGLPGCAAAQLVGDRLLALLLVILELESWRRDTLLLLFSMWALCLYYDRAVCGELQEASRLPCATCVRVHASMMHALYDWLSQLPAEVSSRLRSPLLTISAALSQSFPGSELRVKCDQGQSGQTVSLAVRGDSGAGGSCPSVLRELVAQLKAVGGSDEQLRLLCEVALQC